MRPVYITHAEGEHITDSCHHWYGLIIFATSSKMKYILDQEELVEHDTVGLFSLSSLATPLPSARSATLDPDSLTLDMLERNGRTRASYKERLHMTHSDGIENRIRLGFRCSDIESCGTFTRKTCAQREGVIDEPGSPGRYNKINGLARLAGFMSPKISDRSGRGVRMCSDGGDTGGSYVRPWSKGRVTTTAEQTMMKVEMDLKEESAPPTAAIGPAATDEDQNAAPSGSTKECSDGPDDCMSNGRRPTSKSAGCQGRGFKDGGGSLEPSLSTGLLLEDIELISLRDLSLHEVEGLGQLNRLRIADLSGNELHDITPLGSCPCLEVNTSSEVMSGGYQ